MVMIPTDVGVQVRTQTETPLQSLRPVSEIPSDLPDLQKGQVFRANIQEVLPENTFKALVAGKLMTLSLPEGAKIGDTLDLVVVDRTLRMIVAKLVDRSLAAAGEPYQFTTLSRTGQLIASLLAPAGESAVPTELARGRALLSQVPASAAALIKDLPPKLAQAVSDSGLFYEAHQVQWALGQRSLASLLAEPQGRQSSTETLADFGMPETEQESAAKLVLAARREAVAAPPPAVTLLQVLFGADVSAASAATELPPQSGQAASALAIPDELRPLVQQQLDAAATQRLVWQGEIWPGQDINWEIERDGAQSESAPDQTPAWATSLRLSLPRLGAVDARLQISGQNVQLVLRATDAASVSDLYDAIPSLQGALAAGGMKLQSVQTYHDVG